MKKYYGKGFKILLGFLGVFIVVMLLGDRVEVDEYTCIATSIDDWSGEWPKERIKKWKPNSKIKVHGWGSLEPGTISRCSLSPETEKNSCDVYKIDYKKNASINQSNLIKLKIFHELKLYNYKAQMDIQIFTDPHGLISYLENNGDGGISRGKCQKIRTTEGETRHFFNFGAFITSLPVLILFGLFIIGIYKIDT